MNPFLYGLYQFLKLLTRTSFRIFYPYSDSEGGQHLRFRGPGIVVSNHPNTLLDVLNTAMRTRRLVFFLANAGLFQHPVANWLLNRLYCIPIKRAKDADNRRVNNAESFSRSYDHLAGGGVMYIAPEGGSEMERRLRPLKTGTARIALGAEAKRGFGLDLHIYPVGLNYEQPRYCGSRQYVRVGEPLRVADWRGAYERDQIRAVKELTRELESRMRSLVLHTTDARQDQLLYRLETLLRNDEPLPAREHHYRSRALLAQLQRLQADDPTAYHALIQAAEDYRQLLREHGLTDRGVSPATPDGWGLWTWLGAPIWAYGRLNNLLPFEVPRMVQRRLGLYPGYDATVKIGVGWFTFPVFYALQTWLFSLFFPAWGWLYLLSLPISGRLAWRYARYVQPRREKRKWLRWKKEHAEMATQVQAQRERLRSAAL